MLLILCSTCCSTTTISGMGLGYTLKTFSPVFVYLIIGIVGLVFLIYTFNPNLGYYSDSARYYLLGQSLASGHGLLSVWEAGWPIEKLSSPGYPLLIALLSIIGLERMFFAKIATGLFFIGSSVISFKLFRILKFHFHIAFLCSILISVNVELLRHSSIMLTELPFAFISTLSLYYIIKSEENGGKEFNVSFWLAIFLSIASFYMRMVGVAVIGSIFLNEIIHKRWKKSVITAIIPSIFCLPWIIRLSTLNGLTHFALITSDEKVVSNITNATLFVYLTRIFNNLSRYLSIEIPIGLTPFGAEVVYSNRALGFILGILIVVFTIYGLSRLQKGRTIIITYISMYTGILLLFPSVFSGIRFLLPLIPLIIGMSIFGFYSIVEKYIAGSNIKYVQFGLVIFILFSLYGVHRLSNEVKEPISPQLQRYFQAAIWSGKNLPKEANVATVLGVNFFFYSGRVTTNFAPYDDVDIYLRRLISEGVTHLIVDENVWTFSDKRIFIAKNFVDPLVKYHPQHFEEIYRSNEGNTYILRLIYE